MPAAFAEDWIDFVLAVRQPLSEPTCEKPSVITRRAALRRCGLPGCRAGERGGEHQGDARRA